MTGEGDSCQDDHERIIDYVTLRKISTIECGEGLIDLSNDPANFECKYHVKDMLPYCGHKMLVRESVAIALRAASEHLRRIRPAAVLRLVYAYRHPEIQQRYFDEIIATMLATSPMKKKEELYAEAHLLIAVPEVAGHPTGGAVDLTIAENGIALDMGTTIADFSDTELIRTFSTKASPTQRANRMLLRKVMMLSGFAPFDGEWWHFCLGDKEWAAYYGKPNAIYSSLAVDSRLNPNS